MLSFESRNIKSSTNFRVIISLISILLGMIVGGIAMISKGFNPLIVYKSIFVGGFSSNYAISETIVVSIPLILISVGLTLAFKIGCLNIGAYGQYIIGAIFSSYFALNFSELNRPSLLVVMCLSGIIGGGLWALLPAILKVYWKVNEIICTLLLNYIALYVLQYLMYGPWRDPDSFGFPLTKPFVINAQLPRLVLGSRIHLGLIFGIISSIIMWMVIEKTVFGFEVKAIGYNEIASRTSGIYIKKNIILTMIISGSLAGLAGMSQVSGVIRLLQTGINQEFGYTSIIVTWISNLNPLIVIPVAFFLGGLMSGTSQIQIDMRIPIGIVNLIQSSILFFLLGGMIFSEYKLCYKGRKII